MRGESFYNNPISLAVYSATIITVSLICQLIKIKVTGLYEPDGRA